MGDLTSSERKAVERAAAEPMLDQVLAWASVNSGSRNLGGLERMADLLVDAFAALPGVLRLDNPQPEVLHRELLEHREPLFVAGLHTHAQRIPERVRRNAVGPAYATREHCP